MEGEQLYLLGKVGIDIEDHLVFAGHALNINLIYYSN